MVIWSIGHESEDVGTVYFGTESGVGTIYFPRKNPRKTMGFSNVCCAIPGSILCLEVVFIGSRFYLPFWWYHSFYHFQNLVERLVKQIIPSNRSKTIMPNEVRVREFFLDINTYGNICICQGEIKYDS